MPKLSWGQLAGAIGKILDRTLDPKLRIDWKIEALKTERDKILAKNNRNADDERQLSLIVHDIVRFREERGKISS